MKAQPLRLFPFVLLAHVHLTPISTTFTTTQQDQLSALLDGHFTPKKKKK